MDKITVLIIEDEEFFHRYLQKTLGDDFSVISAYSVKEGEELFAETPRIHFIAVDACVPGNSPTTIPLVRMMRESFRGPMIAISGNSDYRKRLMDAGCDHQCKKLELPQKILQILHPVR